MYYTRVKKRTREAACASSLPAHVKALPCVDVLEDGKTVRALVDTGCTQTIVAKRLAKCVLPCSGSVIQVDGSSVKCAMGDVVVSVNSHEIKLNCLILDSMMAEFDLIVGMDVIHQLGGMHIGSRDSL